MFITKGKNYSKMKRYIEFGISSFLFAYFRLFSFMVYNSTFYFEFPPCCKDKTQLTKHSVFLTGVASAAILVVGLTIYICNMYICTYLPLLYFSYTIFVVVLLLDGQCGTAVGATTIYPFVCIDSMVLIVVLQQHSIHLYV